MAQLIKEVYPTATAILGYAPFTAGQAPAHLIATKEFALQLQSKEEAVLANIFSGGGLQTVAVTWGVVMDDKKVIVPKKLVVVNKRQVLLKQSGDVLIV